MSEVLAAFDRYERALTDNDVTLLKELFWDSSTTIRYGEAENLYGADQIHAFRAARPSGPRPRDLLSVRITTFGQDFAVANADSEPERKPAGAAKSDLDQDGGRVAHCFHARILYGHLAENGWRSRGSDCRVLETLGGARLEPGTR